MNISIREKLLGGFGLICLLTVISSAGVVVQVRNMRTIQHQIHTVRIPSALAATRLSRYISDCGFTFRNYLLYHGDPVLAAKYETARQKAWQNLFDQLDTLKKLSPPEDSELMARLESDIRNGSLQIQLDALNDLKTGGDKGLGLALERMKGGAAKAGKVQADAVELTGRVEGSLNQDNEALNHAQSRALWAAVFAGFLTALAGAFVGWLTSKQILSGILLVSNRLSEIAEGDLAGSPLVHSVQDEIGSMVESINHTQTSLRTMIDAVQAHSTQVAGAAQELSSSMSELTRNTDEQKHHSEQIVAAMHEMQSAINEVSTNAERAADGAGEAGQVAQEGGEVVAATVSAMQNLTDTSRVTSEQVSGLSLSSDRIGKVVSVIDEIAGQTNLLALNAAIEAARAGEQGRGFAVVAGEVRRLAERTGQATREIGQMIGGIQSEARNVVDSISTEIVHVTESAASARKAGDSIQNILTASGHVKSMISHIATASREQATTIEEINRNVNGIAQGIDQIATSTQDSATACNELSHLASELQNAISVFRLSRH